MCEDSAVLVLAAIRRMLQDEVISEHELELAPIADLIEEESK